MLCHSVAHAVATADTSVVPAPGLAGAFLSTAAAEAVSGRWKAVRMRRKLPVQATSQPTKVVVARLRGGRVERGGQLMAKRVELQAYGGLENGCNADVARLPTSATIRYPAAHGWQHT